MAGRFLLTAGPARPATRSSRANSFPADHPRSRHRRALPGTAGSNTANAYPLTITASNGVAPDATQSFTLTVLNVTTTTLTASAPRVLATSR